MTPSRESGSEPDPGGLWNLALRWDELPVVERALAGGRLSAEEAEVSSRIQERLSALIVQIERQAR